MGISAEKCSWINIPSPATAYLQPALSTHLSTIGVYVCLTASRSCQLFLLLYQPLTYGMYLFEWKLGMSWHKVHFNGLREFRKVENDLKTKRKLNLAMMSWRNPILWATIYIHTSVHTLSNYKILAASKPERERVKGRKGIEKICNKDVNGMPLKFSNKRHWLAKWVWSVLLYFVYVFAFVLL